MFKEIVFATSLAAAGLFMQSASAAPVSQRPDASVSGPAIAWAQYYGPPGHRYGQYGPPGHRRHYERAPRRYGWRNAPPPRSAYRDPYYRYDRGYRVAPYIPRQGTVFARPHYNAPHEYTPQPFSR